MKMLAYTLVLAAAGTTGVLSAEPALKGHVYDSQTGQAVPGVSITFYEDTGNRNVKEVTSDVAGSYNIALHEGTYDLLATKTVGKEQREQRLRLVVKKEDQELDLRLGPRHAPGGEFARIIFGLDQAAGSSASATFKYSFDLFLSSPMPFRQNPDPDFGARWRLWGNVKLASVPQQLTSKLQEFNLPGAVANLQVNEMAQSAEFRGGISARIAQGRSFALSFDKETLQKFSLHAVIGLGGSTPLNPRDTLEIFKVSNDAVARFPQAKGKELIGFTGPDRDRFYRQAFGGLEVRAHYFDKNEVASDRFPATFSLTYGFDEAVTRGQIRGGVFRADGFYPLPTKVGSQFYFFFSTLMKPTRARSSDPLLLEPAPGKTLSDVINNGVKVTVPPIDRDYYRVGIGMDLIRLVQYIQETKGKKNGKGEQPQTSQPDKTGQPEKTGQH
jgi:hypothetical protein